MHEKINKYKLEFIYVSDFNLSHSRILSQFSKCDETFVQGC